MSLTMALQACGGRDQVEFDTPWEGASPTADTVSGAFVAELGSGVPGAGWFEAPSLTAHDLSDAQVHDVDATWSTVQVRILGRQGSSWNILELDVALNRWVAGPVAMDGESAVGQLTAADGSVRYLVGGEIVVEAAGIEKGQLVRGSFSQIPLLEVR